MKLPFVVHHLGLLCLPFALSALLVRAIAQTPLQRVTDHLPALINQSRHAGVVPADQTLNWDWTRRQ